jgi:predicted ATPase/DNA-binding SARP family transcriptional activator
VASGMANSSGGMQIELLGPVEARVDGRAVALGGQRPRALLAVLALMGGRVVPTDRLIDELWGDEPPARARDSLQMHVSRLRKGLAEAGAAGGRLVSQSGGYLLDVRPGERDVDRWQQALARARRARAGGEPRVAREGVDEALGVWRGPPLGGVSANSLLAAERARLEEERLAAIIEGIELDLELGRHGELLGQMDALVIAHPFQERLVELQMLALYRCGRQADALAAFHAARGRFVDELGIEPAQGLRDLHEDVLKHSAEISTPVDTTAERTVDAQPRSATASPLSNRRLPVPPNRTIGRERDVAAVGERLQAGPVRLLTLTGPGGVGKTRLALEAARAVQADFADGAHFVSLAALHRPEDVPATIVNALGIIVLSGESADQAAERFLSAKHLLVITDNLEHLLAAAPFIARMLEACPALTVLATSRAPLTLQAEERYPVSPLALPELGTPEDPQTLADTDAVALFCERARAHDPDFRLSSANAAAVAEICRRVDGLPLAIELAAARCGLLSPTEIADRLDTALGALGAGARDAPARQQTLRATIDWSHDLLSAAEKQCFARFAVFAGGAAVPAAEAITGAGLDVLDGLVAKSLLVRRQHAHAPTRVGMLETIRADATQRFAAAADHDAVRERHYRHYLALAERHGDERGLWGAAGKEHLARLDAEIDNFHAALAYALGHPGAERALAMAAALGWYWVMRNRYADAVNWIDQALAKPGVESQSALRVRLLCVKAMVLMPLRRRAEQHAAMTQAEAIARALGDPVNIAQVLQLRADQESFLGRLDVAEPFADAALDWAMTARDDWVIARAAYAQALVAPTIAELRKRVDRAASLLDEAGNVYQLAGLLAGAAAYTALMLGSERDAKEYVARALAFVQGLDDPFTWMVFRGNLGLAALLTGDTDAAEDAFRDELRLCRELVVLPHASEGLQGLGAVAVVRGDDQRAARLLGAAAEDRRDRPEDPVDARLDTEFFEPARTRHGADAWDAAVRDGGTLSFDDAIAYALQEPRA